MSIDERSFEQSLAVAEQQEIVAGEETFVADLRDVVTQRGLAKGLHIDFGNDRELFSRTINILGLPEALSTDEERRARVAMFASAVICNSATSYVDSTLSDLKDLHPTQAVEALQADGWRVNPEDTYPQVQPISPEVTSRLIIGKLNERGSIDPSRFVALLGLKCFYLPSFERPTAGTATRDMTFGPSLSYLMREERAEGRGGDMREPAVSTIAEHIADDDVLRVGVARSNYFLELGNLRGNKDVHVHPDNRFSVQRGRLIEVEQTR